MTNRCCRNIHTTRSATTPSPCASVASPSIRHELLLSILMLLRLIPPLPPNPHSVSIPPRLIPRLSSLRSPPSGPPRPTPGSASARSVRTRVASPILRHRVAGARHRHRHRHRLLSLQ
ncbi:hypothetical protein M758_11G031800 [Ceratodon purpureus]|nr:hypothetical protein M758_11G031800 [Ceratodon purpureus]